MKLYNRKKPIEITTGMVTRFKVNTSEVTGKIEGVEVWLPQFYRDWVSNYDLLIIDTTTREILCDDEIIGEITDEEAEDLEWYFLSPYYEYTEDGWKQRGY